MLAGVLLNAYLPPRRFPWFNLLSLGFPVMMIAYAFLTFIWIFLKKKRAVFFVLIGLIFINPVRRWINFSPEKKETPNLKIITLNTKGGKFGTHEIEEFVSRQNADLVFLQEDGDVEYQFSGLKRNSKIFVVSLYSKFEVVDHRELFEGMYSEDFNAYADYTDLKFKDKTVRIINMYLQPFKFEKKMVKLNGNSKEDEEKVKNIVKRLIPTFKAHQEQVEIIRKAIDDSPYPVIVAGDFNSVPNSYEYYHISNGLKDAFVEAGNGSATSFHEYKFPIRIDYIFTSPSIKATSYRVDRSVRLSDHFPVIATFKID